MNVLVDAALLQLRPPGSAEVRDCVGILEQMADLAEARGVALTILDRGGLPSLSVDVLAFPSYAPSDAAADAGLLQTVGDAIGANAFVSTAFTVPLLLPAIQLVICDGAALHGDDDAALEQEIAVACSRGHLCASEEAEVAFASRFPHTRPTGRDWLRSASDVLLRTRETASAVLDAALSASSSPKDEDLAGKLLTLRRMQAAFETRDG